MNRTAHVAVASLNQTVGDWSGNRERITRVIQEARRRGARLLVLPEMCIPGYSLGDRLLMRGTLSRSWAVLEELCAETAERFRRRRTCRMSPWFIHCSRCSSDRLAL